MKRISPVPRAATLALALGLALPSAVAGQDVLTVGSGTAYAGATAVVPVYVRDVNSTSLGVDAGSGNRIQGIAFKVTYTNPGAVANITFTRGGILAALTPLFENSISSAGGIVYLGSFSESSNAVPFDPNSPAPGDLIGALQITFSAQAAAGTSLSLTVDPSTATLSNQAGTVGETVANGKLALAQGTATVDGYSSATTLTSSVNPSLNQQTVTFTAFVTSPASGQLTGNVTFRDGETAIGNGTLLSGQATLSIASLSIGAHNITATYSGNTSILPSTSSPLSQVVTQGTFGAPIGLSANPGANSIVLNWVPVYGAVGYEVWRTSLYNGAYSLIGSPVSNSWNDTPLPSNQSFLYKVKAIDGSATRSEYSAVAVGTTVVFSDDPLLPTVTRVKAAHLMELRVAVNAVRAVAGLAPAVFTQSDLAGAPIQALHLQELRNALMPALSIAGLPPLNVTDSTITNRTTLVKATHLQEIRNAVK